MKLFKAKAPKWYKPIGDGKLNPLWTVPKADGSGDTTPTLRHAKKFGLLPSVTEILKVIHKPALDRYKLNQVLQSALTLPRLDGEGIDAFALRVELDSDEHRNAAADLGTRIHSAIAASLAGVPVPEDMSTYLREWMGFQTGITDSITETTIGSERLGYAGTLDLAGRRDSQDFIFDFKSQDVKPDSKPNFYDEWALQLAAYAQSFPIQPRLMSIIISTNPETRGQMFTYIWPREHSYYYEAFQNAFGLWRYLRDGFDPRTS